MSWRELLAAAREIRDAVLGAQPELAGLALAGIGWATVEGERAMGELDAVLPSDPSVGIAADPRWVRAPRDEALGARAWLRVAEHDDPAALIVLEPDTEGRLAAALARRGEGVAAIYIGRRIAGTTRGRGGPLGPGHVVTGAPAWGPHVIVLDRGAPGAVGAEGRKGAA